ncbi:MAG: hypothetical protein ACQEWA_00285 [Sphaerochaetaceae bacterium]
MTITGYLITAGILLMLIDIFFRTDVPTYIAYLLFSYALFRVIKLNLLVSLIVTILFFFLLLLFHNFIWNATIQRLTDRFFAKDKYIAGVEGLAGEKGVAKMIDGTFYASIHGDLYLFADDVDISEGESFTVKEVVDGKIII